MSMSSSSDSAALSVLLPTYNFKHGLLRNLEFLSRLSHRTRMRLEVLVSDNSAYPLLDSTEIDSYSSLFGTFKYGFNLPSRPAASNWNFLFSIATGRYHWLIHHDEYPVGSESFIENLACNPKIYPKKIFIFKLKKSFKIRLLSRRMDILFWHSLPTSFYEYLLRTQLKLLVFCNYVGPVSTLIVPAEVSSAFIETYRWLVDVRYYLDIIGSADPLNVKVISEAYGYIVSDQSRDIPTLTSSMSRQIPILRKREMAFLNNDEHKICLCLRFLAQWPIKLLLRFGMPRIIIH